MTTGRRCARCGQAGALRMRTGDPMVAQRPDATGQVGGEGALGQPAAGTAPGPRITASTSRTPGTSA
jgi:hypothetical protein